MRALLLLSLTLPACTLYEPDDDGPAPLVCREPEVRSYRVSVIDVPNTAEQARALGWDFDGDEAIDNQGGSVISAIEQAVGVDLQGAVEQALDSDLVLIGMTVEECGAPSFTTVALHEGVSLDRSLDPPVLYGEEVTFEPAVYVGLPPAAAVGGVTRFPVGQLIHPAADEWIDAPDFVAFVQRITEDELSGRLAGALDGEQVYQVVSEAFVLKMADRIAEAGPDDEVVQTMLDVFDDNTDGVITLEEVQNDSLVRTLLAPDLDTDGDGVADALSIGIGFRAERVELAL